jgi:hypothetical protein
LDSKTRNGLATQIKKKDTNCSTTNLPSKWCACWKYPYNMSNTSFTDGGTPKLQRGKKIPRSGLQPI